MITAVSSNVFPHSVGLWRNDKHEYWWAEEGGTVVGPLVSVTTALKVLDKPQLVGWAKRETAACAVRNLEMVNQLVATGGPDAAIAWLKTIPDYIRDTAADLGTRVHILAEKMGMFGVPDATEEEAPFVAQYRHFLDLYQPEILKVEFKVCSLTHRYAGTADLLARIGGETWLIDFKTGTGIYPETALQLAGLGFADFMGWAEDPKQYPIPPIDRYGVLHLRPDRFDLVPYAVSHDTFEQFLRCLRLYEWMRGSRKLMEEPVPVPAMEEAA